MIPTNRYLRVLSVGFLTGLLLVAVPIMAVNFIVDPYQFYRLHDGPQGPFRDDARYQNAGLMRHIDHDTVLIGTSLSENFTPQMFAPRWQVLKLTAPGSSARTHAVIARAALAQDRARRVLLELSVFAYQKGPGWINQKHTFPDYLYPARATTPFQYLLSTDLLRLSLGMDAGAELRPLEELYTWQALRAGEFGHGGFVGRAELSCGRDLATFRPARDPLIDATVDANLVALLNQHPQAEFIGFLPPLPLVAMYIQSEARVGQRLQFRQYMRDLAARHANFRVHDFALLRPLIEDVRRYKDLAHYDQDGNREMAVHLLAGTMLAAPPESGDALLGAAARLLPEAGCRGLLGSRG